MDKRSAFWWRTAGVQVVLILLSFTSVQTGKLLVVPTDGSHWTGMKPLVEEMGRRGHEVVVVIPDASMSMGQTENSTTLTYPVPYSSGEVFDELRMGVNKAVDVDISSDLKRFLVFWISLYMLKDFTVRNCESLLSNEDLMKTLKNWDFDAILTDPFEPVGVIVGEYLSLPSIYMQVNLLCGIDRLANHCPSPPSYVPQGFSHYTHRMTFWQRTVNMVKALLQPLACRFLYSKTNEIASKFLQRDVSVEEIMSRASLWLMRSDFTLEFPRPVMPNMVMIGGVSSAKKAKPLPKDLEDFVNGSGDDGFVVFTLGSMVSELPEAKAWEFFKAFSQIPQRVLWRYTGKVPEDAPKNVKLMKWLPQKDLLAHPKAKAFITHGGTHGIYEGICNAVPMVMIPLFGDQGDNTQRMMVRGVAETLNIYDVTSEKLLTALRKVINDKSYKDNMVKLSSLHKDRPVEPLELAVFWTEFVMRHKGAEHLRPAAHQLNWIQYHSVDVIGFLLLLLVTMLFITIKTCTFCCSKCLRKTHKKKKE